MCIKQWSGGICLSEGEPRWQMECASSVALVHIYVYVSVVCGQWRIFLRRCLWQQWGAHAMLMCLACGVLGRAARAMSRDHTAVVPRYLYSVCVRAEDRVFSASSIDDTTVSVRV